MNQQTLRKILAVVLEKLEEMPMTWRLEGSANLFVQEVATEVRCVDICTTKTGINLCNELFAHSVIQRKYKQDIRSEVLTLRLFGEEVELLAYDEPEKTFFDKTTVKEWEGLQVHILPLEYAKTFYEKIGRKEKVKLIEEYLQR